MASKKKDSTHEYSKMPPPSFYARCIRPFFFSKYSDYLKAPYFWASVMMLLTVCTIVKILCGYPEYTPLAGIETGLALGLIAVYNQGARNVPK